MVPYCSPKASMRLPVPHGPEATWSGTSESYHSLSFSRTDVSVNETCKMLNMSSGLSQRHVGHSREMVASTPLTRSILSLWYEDITLLSTRNVRTSIKTHTIVKERARKCPLALADPISPGDHNSLMCSVPRSTEDQQICYAQSESGRHSH